MTTPSQEDIEYAEKDANDIWKDAAELTLSIKAVRSHPSFNGGALWDIVMAQNTALMCQLKANALRLRRIEEKLGITSSTVTEHDK